MQFSLTNASISHLNETNILLLYEVLISLRYILPKVYDFS